VSHEDTGMAETTIKSKVYFRSDKADKTEVKIIVSHKRVRRSIDTNILVRRDQVKKIRGMSEYEITDSLIKKSVAKKVEKYEQEIVMINERIRLMDVDQIRQHLLDMDKEKVEDNEFINIIAFGNDYIKELRENKRESSASTIQTVVNNLKDFVGGDILGTDELTYDFMLKFERYMRSDRKQTRLNHGRMTTVIRKGVGDAGIHTTMRDFRILLYEARKRYNEEELGIIKIRNNPFKKYKVIDPPHNEVEPTNINDVLKVGYAMVMPGGREELAKFMCLLSFYLCGMNMADIYHLDCDFYGRAEYNRSKTKGRRKDRAFISVNVPDHARDIIEAWRGKIKKRYCSHKSFLRAVNEGLKTLLPGKTSYQFRDIFGDQARNTCGFSKDDVGLALNHYDRSTSTTDPYLSKNWAIVDKVQAGVLGLLSSELSV